MTHRRLLCCSHFSSISLYEFCKCFSLFWTTSNLCHFLLLLLFFVIKHKKKFTAPIIIFSFFFLSLHTKLLMYIFLRTLPLCCYQIVSVFCCCLFFFLNMYRNMYINQKKIYSISIRWFHHHAAEIVVIILNLKFYWHQGNNIWLWNVYISIQYNRTVVEYH